MQFNKKIRLMVSRYDHSQTIFTQLDPVEDVKNLVSYLAIPDHLAAVLVSKNSFDQKDAEARAKLICPHIEVALDFFDQLRNSASTIAFLPAYYMTLNLMKACILIGDKWEELAQQSSHGASYRNQDDGTFNLLEEGLTIWPKGAFPLFYSTLTGEEIESETDIEMADIYHYLNGVSAEYSIATGSPPELACLDCRFESDDHGRPIRPVFSVISNPPPDISLAKLQFLKGFKTEDSHRFFGSDLPPKEKYSIEEMKSTVLFDDQIRRCLIYHDLGDCAFFTPVSDGPLLMPEEFPIALMFFHMSNVVRYKPDLLYQTRSSVYWPLLTACLRHTSYQFLLLFWSFMHKTKLVVGREQTSHIA